MSAFSKMLQLAKQPTLVVPLPEDDVGEALWSLPEVLRVNAELVLWHGGPDAFAAAETRLRRALKVAQAQSALSWELRAATSLARLLRDQDRASAHGLLAATYDRFTEGFESRDLVEARALLSQLS